MSVQRLDLAELDTRRVDHQRAVEATPGIDHWCSGLDWILPAHLAFGVAGDAGAERHTAEPIVVRTAGGFACLARYRRADGSAIIAGLEPLWGFAAPIVGPDPTAVLAETARWLAEDPDWTLLYLPGYPDVPGSSVTPDAAVSDAVMGAANALARAIDLDSLGVAEGITRQRLDLSDGFEGWLARRSPRLIRNLRRARRRAEAADVSFVVADDEPHLINRLVAIEQRSWKGAEQSGLTAVDMARFYALMIDRLAPQRRVRCVVARRDGRDVGYILGGVRGHTYRGWQLSHTTDVAEYSIGHLLQCHEIDRMARSGLRRYDLGMDMGYKVRLADDHHRTVALVAVRRYRSSARHHPRPAEPLRSEP